MKIISWNVNGLRAVAKKGFADWFKSQSADIVCLQETKADADQLSDDLVNIAGYRSYFASAEKKGYSGVAVWAKRVPDKISIGLGEKKFDSEGRSIELHFGDVVLFNVYFPNGKASGERLAYKMEFYEAFLDKIESLRKKGKKIIFCGDVNTAHKEIDLARPKENEMTSGFLPVERAWIDKVVNAGYIDTFRVFQSEGGHYSWWDYKTRARERNVGWRIDYFFVSDNLKKNLKKAFIQTETEGSDHCPIGIEIDI